MVLSEWIYGSVFPSRQFMLGCHHEGKSDSHFPLPIRLKERPCIIHDMNLCQIFYNNLL